MFTVDRAKEEKNNTEFFYHFYTLLDTQYITERSSSVSESPYKKNDVYSRDRSVITIILYKISSTVVYQSIGCATS